MIGGVGGGSSLIVGLMKDRIRKEFRKIAQSQV
jgi:hypothetical protein